MQCNLHRTRSRASLDLEYHTENLYKWQLNSINATIEIGHWLLKPKGGGQLLISDHYIGIMNHRNGCMPQPAWLKSAFAIGASVKSQPL